MRFQLKVQVTEEEYLEQILYEDMKSPRGKKRMVKNRLRILVSYALITALFLVISRPSVKYTMYFLAFLVVYSAVHMLLFNSIVKFRLKRWFKRAMKDGTAHLDREAEYGFYEDKLVETTRSTNTEQTYEGVTGVCIRENMITIYAGAGYYMLPVSQIKQQVDYDAFATFLAEKCKSVEWYPAK